MSPYSPTLSPASFMPLIDVVRAESVAPDNRTRQPEAGHRRLPRDGAFDATFHCRRRERLRRAVCRDAAELRPVHTRARSGRRRTGTTVTPPRRGRRHQQGTGSFHDRAHRWTSRIERHAIRGCGPLRGFRDRRRGIIEVLLPWRTRYRTGPARNALGSTSSAPSSPKTCAPGSTAAAWRRASRRSRTATCTSATPSRSA